MTDEIKALAEEILERNFKEQAKKLKQPLDFKTVKQLPAYTPIISAMCEIYKAALSGAERVECYLPTEITSELSVCYWDSKEFQFRHEVNVKKATLIVLRESDLVTSDNNSEGAVRATLHSKPE